MSHNRRTQVTCIYHRQGTGANTMMSHHGLNRLHAYTIDTVKSLRIFILNDVTQWTYTSYMLIP